MRDIIGESISFLLNLYRLG